MEKGIIDDVEMLMTLSDDELTEVLLGNKYNKSNLRELVRRTLSKTKEYKKAFEYQLDQQERLEGKLDDLKGEISEVFDDL